MPPPAPAPQPPLSSEATSALPDSLREAPPPIAVMPRKTLSRPIMLVVSVTEVPPGPPAPTVTLTEPDGTNTPPCSIRPPAPPPPAPSSTAPPPPPPTTSTSTTPELVTVKVPLEVNV